MWAHAATKALPASTIPVMRSHAGVRALDTAIWFSGAESSLLTAIPPKFPWTGSGPWLALRSSRSWFKLEVDIVNRVNDRARGEILSIRRLALQPAAPEPDVTSDSRSHKQ
jgi:hypothetical protein